MVILSILECDLSLLLELGQLIEVLEHQVLHSLLVDLDLDLVLLVQVLQLTLLVTQLRLLVLQLLLANDPKVVDSLPFILVEPCQVFLLADLVLEGSTLHS